MKSMINGDEVFSAVEKVRPRKNDVLVFSIKTDEYGDPLMDMNTLYEHAFAIADFLKQRGISCVFLYDKIRLSGTRNKNKVIKQLEEIKNAVVRAINKVRAL